MSPEKTIFIFADWIGLSKPFLIGTARVSIVRGKEIIAFEYAEEWPRTSDPTDPTDPSRHHHVGVAGSNAENSRIRNRADASGIHF